MIYLSVWKYDIYFGRTEASYVRIHETSALPNSIAYICPFCGNLWARAMYTFNGTPARWFPYMASCKSCPPYAFDSPSGIIALGGMRDEFLGHLSHAALEAEFISWFNYITKQGAFHE